MSIFWYSVSRCLVYVLVVLASLSFKHCTCFATNVGLFAPSIKSGQFESSNAFEVWVLYSVHFGTLVCYTTWSLNPRVIPRLQISCVWVRSRFCIQLGYTIGSWARYYLCRSACPSRRKQSYGLTTCAFSNEGLGVITCRTSFVGFLFFSKLGSRDSKN